MHLVGIILLLVLSTLIRSVNCGVPRGDDYYDWIFLLGYDDDYSDSGPEPHGSEIEPLQIDPNGDYYDYYDYYDFYDMEIDDNVYPGDHETNPATNPIDDSIDQPIASEEEDEEYEFEDIFDDPDFLERLYWILLNVEYDENLYEEQPIKNTSNRNVDAPQDAENVIENPPKEETAQDTIPNENIDDLTDTENVDENPPMQETAQDTISNQNTDDLTDTEIVFEIPLAVETVYYTTNEKDDIADPTIYDELLDSLSPEEIYELNDYCFVYGEMPEYEDENDSFDIESIAESYYQHKVFGENEDNDDLVSSSDLGSTNEDEVETDSSDNVNKEKMSYDEALSTGNADDSVLVPDIHPAENENNEIEKDVNEQVEEIPDETQNQENVNENAEESDVKDGKEKGIKRFTLIELINSLFLALHH